MMMMTTTTMMLVVNPTETATSQHLETAVLCRQTDAAL